MTRFISLVISLVIFLFTVSSPLMAQTTYQWLLPAPNTDEDSTQAKLFSDAGKTALTGIINSNFPQSTSQSMLPMLIHISDEDTRPYEERKNEAYTNLTTLYKGLENNPNTPANDKVVMKEIIDALGPTNIPQQPATPPTVQAEELPISATLAQVTLDYIRQALDDEKLTETISFILKAKLKEFAQSFDASKPFAYPLTAETLSPAQLYLVFIALETNQALEKDKRKLERKEVLTTLVSATFKDFIETKAEGRPFIIKDNQVEAFVSRLTDFIPTIVDEYNLIEPDEKSVSPAQLLAHLNSLIIEMIDMPASKINTSTDEEATEKSDKILADMRKISKPIEDAITGKNIENTAKEPEIVAPEPSDKLSEMAHTYLNKRVVLENILDEVEGADTDPISENMKFHLKNLASKIHTEQKAFAFPEKEYIFTPASLLLLMSKLARSAAMFTNIPTNLKPEPVKKEILNTLLFSTFNEDSLLEPGTSKTFKIPEAQGQNFADKAALLLTETFVQSDVVDGKEAQDNILDYEKLIAEFLKIADETVEMTDDDKLKLQMALDEAMKAQRLKNTHPLFAFMKAKPQITQIEESVEQGLLTTEMRDYYTGFAQNLSLETSFSFPTVAPDSISTAKLAMAYVLLLESGVFNDDAHPEIKKELQKMIVIGVFAENDLLENNNDGADKPYKILETKEVGFDARTEVLIAALYELSDEIQTSEKKPTHEKIAVAVKDLIEAIIKLTVAETAKVEEEMEATYKPFEEQIGDDHITIDTTINNPAEIAFENALKNHQPPFAGMQGERNETLIAIAKEAIDYYAKTGSAKEPMQKAVAAILTDGELKKQFADHIVAWATTGIPLTEKYKTVEAATQRCVDKIKETTLESGYALVDVFKKPRDKHGVYATLRTDETSTAKRQKVYCGAILLKAE